MVALYAPPNIAKLGGEAAIKKQRAPTSVDSRCYLQCRRESQGNVQSSEVRWTTLELSSLCVTTDCLVSGAGTQGGRLFAKPHIPRKNKLSNLSKVRFISSAAERVDSSVAFPDVLEKKALSSVTTRGPSLGEESPGRPCAAFTTEA